MNPWKVLFELADRLAGRLGARLEMREPYPGAWGVWPAVALYAAFVWIELVFYGSSLPLSISLLSPARKGASTATGASPRPPPRSASST